MARKKNTDPVPSPYRNRIKRHVRIRAGDLVPHDMNFRTHPDGQAQSLLAVYQEVGFARSLLAYEMPDGRLKLLDGHLRRDLTPDMEVDVEVLDVTEDEAKLILATLDPLSALAGADAAKLDALLREVQTESDAMAGMFAKMAEDAGITPPDFQPAGVGDQGRLDEKARVACPECGHEFTP